LSKYYVEMASANPPISGAAIVWQIRHSIFLWGVKWILAGGPLDLAAARVGVRFWPVWAGAILTFSLSVAWWKRRARKGLLIGLMALGLSMGLVIPFTVRPDPAYYPKRLDLKLAQEAITQQAGADDLVLVKSYGSPAWYYWMNWADPKVAWTSLPYVFPDLDQIQAYLKTQDPQNALDPVTLALLAGKVQSGQRVWLVVPSDSPGAELDLEAVWLRGRADMNRAWIFDGGNEHTLLYSFTVK
jgi:hypothetical protein